MKHLANLLRTLDNITLGDADDLNPDAADLLRVRLYSAHEQMCQVKEKQAAALPSHKPFMPEAAQ
jgi:hypothetical protein